jgi:hypothetical protein
MLMHEFMRHQVQLLSYLKGGYLRQMMDVPTAQEKSKQIFFAQPKVHQNKFANLNKTVPTDPLKMIAFFKQCQATDKAAGVLEKIAKDKRPKKRKTAQLPVYVFVPDREPDHLTDSHVKLDTDCIDTDCIDKDCINTNCIDADCINANFNTCE